MLKPAQLKYFLLSLGTCILLSVAGASSAADWQYSFRPGDTLWSVCKEYTKEPTCWSKLGPLNNIGANRKIPPGTRIKIPAAWLKVPPASVTVDFVQGEVTYTLPGSETVAAEINSKLTIGTRIESRSGSATLLFADGSTLILEPFTTIVLDRLSNFELNGMVDSTVRLNQGTIKTRVIKRTPKSSFQTITPSAVASVRGTEYRVNLVQNPGQNETGDPTTFVEVYEGLVSVGAQGKKFDVPANFGIVTKPGQAPQAPVQLLKAPEFLPVPTPQTIFTDDKNQQRSPIEISWKALKEAKSYRLNVLGKQLNAKSTEKLVASYSAPDTSIRITGLTPGCYQLSLRAIDTAGLQGIASKQALCLEKQLLAPKLNQHKSAVPNASEVTISWPPVQAAEAYIVEVSSSEDFSIVTSTIETSDTHFLLRGTDKVYIRVTARNSTDKPSVPSSPINWQPSDNTGQKELEDDENYWQALVPVALFLIGLL